ncbi:MAG: hypothetical protein AAFO77_00695 [Pseudomonadota bacterium]
MAKKTDWSWSDIFDGHRAVTIVLPDFEAEELIDQAALEGRLIGPTVIKGLPAIIVEEFDGDQSLIEECASTQDADNTTDAPQNPVMPANENNPAIDHQANRPTASVSEEPANKPDPKVAILDVVRREPMAVEPASNALQPASDTRSRSPIFGETPPANHAPSPDQIRQAAQNRDLARIAAEALATGDVKVTKCPPCTFSQPQTEPWRGGADGRKRKAGYLRAMRKRSLAKRDGEAVD